jgi:hypothetical protein
MSRRIAVLAVLGLGSIYALGHLSAGDAPTGDSPGTIWLGVATTDKGQVIQIHVDGLIAETPSLTIKRGGSDIEIRPVNGNVHLTSKGGDVMMLGEMLGAMLGTKTGFAEPASVSLTAKTLRLDPVRHVTTFAEPASVSITGKTLRFDPVRPVTTKPTSSIKAIREDFEKSK